jgi:disulfide bond formation protein DsbB
MPAVITVLFQANIANYLIGVVCCLVLATAYAFEYLANLQPCILCLYQRIPYAIAIGLMLLAVILRKHSQANLLLFIAASVVFAVGSAIAVFHIGVEQQLWQGTPECGNFINTTSVEALRKQLLAQPIVRCDEVAWSLFGISMAGYNFLISTSLLLYSSVIIFKRK